MQIEHSVFTNGSQWLRVDFHLHTKVDKEFKYEDLTNHYLNLYIEALKKSGIGLGVITNHNKFDWDEFKNLRKKARQEGIGLLPGIELSVKDGSAGVHVLVVFSDEWIKNRENKNYIQDFLNVTFSQIANSENENARSNHDVLETIRELNKFNKDYFIVFAHVEASNGLWKSLTPGRIDDLFQNPTFKERALGFQKVKTHDEREKIQHALGFNYPAELEGSDPKSIDEIGRGSHCYLKLGAFNFEAVKFALHDHLHRVCKEKLTYAHSYIKSISFEGGAGALGGTKISFSPELNTLIGIRGSGKSSILEGIRYALDIPFGDNASDIEYKNELVVHLLKSGGKITIDAIDRHGQSYKICRILGHTSDVYVNDELQPGVSIRETIFHKPIYFGQKDLSRTSEGFEKDLIEKLVGEALIPIRQDIDTQKQVLINAIREIKRLQHTREKKEEWVKKKQDVEYKIKFYKQHGVEEKLQKQIDFDRDERKTQNIVEQTQNYFNELTHFVATFEDQLKNQSVYQSTQNQIFFDEFFVIYKQVLLGFDAVKSIATEGLPLTQQLKNKLDEFNQKKPWKIQ